MTANDKFVIEECVNRSGNAHYFRGTLKAFKDKYKLNETREFIYKGNFVYIHAPNTKGELMTALHKLSKYDPWFEGISFSLVK